MSFWRCERAMIASESLYSLCPFCLLEVTGTGLVLIRGECGEDGVELTSPACAGNNQEEKPSWQSEFIQIS